MSRKNSRPDRRTVLKSMGAAGLAGLAGCAGDGGDDTAGETDDTTTEAETTEATTTTAAESESMGRTLKLGVVMGVTGGLAQLGPPIVDAAEMAATQIDEADTPFSVDVGFEDTATDPNTGISAAKSLVNQGYPMLNGALSSTVTIQVALNAAIPNGVVQCSPASTSPAITTLDDNDFVYRATPSDALQAQVMVQIARNRLDAQTTAYFALNNDYGQGIAEAYAESFRDAGGEVVGEVAFEPGQSSYSSQLATALAEDPDVMMMIGYPESGVQIFRDYYSDYSADATDILVGAGLRDPEMPGNVGNTMSNVTGVSPQSSGPGKEYFVEQYKNEFERDLSPFVAEAYDSSAVMLLANAAAGENDGAAIRDQIRTVAQGDGMEVTPENLAAGVEAAANGEAVNYQGAAGEIAFDDNGDISTATYEYFQYVADGVEGVEDITYTG